MTVYRCATCKALPLAPVRPLLDDRYASGYCDPCRKVTVYRREDSGMAARARGIDSAAVSAAQGVDAAWRIEAEAEARRLAARGEPFTIEDITDRVGMPAHHPNAVGALIFSLSRAGVIEWTGQMQASRRSDRHGNLNRVWRGRRAA